MTKIKRNLMGSRGQTTRGFRAPRMGTLEIEVRSSENKALKITDQP